jgi:histidinol-phosphate aminotransferase
MSADEPQVAIQLIQLSRNEMPYGPLPGVTEAVTRAMGHSHRYPDANASELIERLACHNGVDPSRIAIGCGSVAVLESLADVVCEPGDRVAFPWPSYRGYPVVATKAGAIGLPVPNTPSHDADLTALSDAVTKKTRMVILCNPNNPTGAGTNDAGLRTLASRVAEDVLLVVDEAYREFAPAERVADALSVLSERRNVVVVRTMSKAWSLAGLRVGYLVGPAELAAAVRKAATPYATSSVAQAAALAALDAEDEMTRRCALVAAERDRLTARLRGLLPGIPTSSANFIWLPLGEHSGSFTAGCLDLGVHVCDLSPYGVRVSIGDPDANEAFLSAATLLVNDLGL